MYLCTTKELRDGLSHQRKKFELGIEPNPNLPRKLRSGMSPNLFRMEYEEFSSFYLHEILKAIPKDAIQDSAYVVLYPNKEMENKTLSLPMGARFGN